MRIQTYLNCTKEDIESKKFNIFIGISLGNKYFSKENIEKYILWGLENTKTDIVVLIADSNHAINYEVFNRERTEKALKIATKKGIEIENIIKEIVQRLPEDKQSLVKTAKWDDTRNSANYKHSMPFILNEFTENIDFYKTILKIINENLGERIILHGLEKERLDKLALYVLDELPIFINGFEFDGKIYNLHPYPGF